VWYTYDLFKSGTVYVVDDLWNTISLISGDGLIPYGELETILAQNQLADASRVANTMAAAARTTASFGNSALAHADDYRARHSNIWFSTYYSSQERDSTGHRTGYKSTTTGYAVGIDTLLRKYDAIVGLALGKSNGKMTPDSGNRTYTAGTIDQDGMQIGLYGRMNQVQPAFHENSVNAEAYITYGQYDCRSERSGRGNGESVSACWDENAWALGVRVSRNYWWRHGMILTPFAGFEYTMADMDSMREMGYTAIDYSCVRVHRQLELLGGLRAQRTLQLRNGQKLTPYGSLGLGFDLLRHNAKVRTASAVGSFSDEATDPGKLSLKLQLGADWFITPRWNTAAGYTFEIRDAAAEHYLQLSASRAF
ncbi:MAG: autotransporter outer membrane beta-barrel domain-containing protein, partial [Akkermansia sp.]|nr:autotransporter outer membrane beta-barrel domain-containing protein [Akkermansia sp.]